VSVGVFIVAMFVVGSQFESGGITGTGALEMVGVITLFVLVMTGVGFWLANQH
jgi:hypothetical protein